MKQKLYFLLKIMGKELMERFCPCYLQVRSVTGKVRRTIINGVWESDFRYVKSIIDAHRGKVWAENKIDGGAKISFTLPLEEEEQNGD